MKNILKVILLTAVLCGFAACQRNNMPYGGVSKNDNSPNYTAELNVNKPVTTK